MMNSPFNYFEIYINKNKINDKMEDMNSAEIQIVTMQKIRMIKTSLPNSYTQIPLCSLQNNHTIILVVEIYDKIFFLISVCLSMIDLFMLVELFFTRLQYYKLTYSNKYGDASSSITRFTISNVRIFKHGRTVTKLKKNIWNKSITMRPAEVCPMKG